MRDLRTRSGRSGRRGFRPRPGGRRRRLPWWLDFGFEVSKPALLLAMLFILFVTLGLLGLRRVCQDRDGRAPGRAAAVERARSERFPQLAVDDPERFARIASENLARVDGIAATQQAYLDIGDSLESRLGELQMPVNIVHGDLDSRIPIECGYSLNDAIRQAQLYIIRDAEHGLMTNAAAERTRGMIMMWLRGVQIMREGYAEMEREQASETA